jgi:hypothetical protein
MITKASIFLLALIFCSHSSFAQIEGGIVDPNGKAVAAAKIVALDSNRVIAGTTSSDERGFYDFLNLKKGTYTIRVKAVGFEDSVTENVKVVKEMAPGSARKDVSRATRLNFILKPETNK